MSSTTERACEPALSPDAVFDVLADRDRRAVLNSLRTAPDGVLSIEALAEGLADGDGVPDGRDRARLVARFHHATVPRLADAGLVEHDARSGSVRYHGHPLVEACLDCLADPGVR